MRSPRNLRLGLAGESIHMLLKGALVGLATVVPGFSAGTLLVVLGIYNRVIEAIDAIVSRKGEWFRSHLVFLTALGIGVTGGALVFAKLVTLVLDRYPVPFRFFLIGLIGGSIPAILRMHWDLRPSFGRIAAFVVGLGLTISAGPGMRGGLHSQPAADVVPLLGLLYLGLVGFLAGGAVVTPGLSGSYIFLLAGTYEPIMQALDSLTAPPVHWRVILATAVGVGMGVAAFSRLIGLLLKRHPATTLYAILGLICGSFASLWPAGLDAATSLLPGALAVAAGLAIAYLLGGSAGIRRREPHVARMTGEK